MNQLISQDHAQARLAAYDILSQRCRELEQENNQLKQRVKRLCCLLKLANEREVSLQTQIAAMRRNSSGAANELGRAHKTT